MFEVGLVEPGSARADFSGGHLVFGPLSDRQARILGALHDARHRGNVTPRLGELAKTVGLSKSTVFYHIGQLERKGYLSRRSGTTGIILSPILWSRSLDVATD